MPPTATKPAGGLKKLNLAGISSAKADTKKRDYPALPDPDGEVAKLVAELRAKSDQLDALDGEVKLLKAEITSKARPFWFEANQGMRRVDMKARMGTLFRKAQEVLPEARRRRPSAPLMKFLSDRVARLVAGEKVVVEQNPPQILEVVVERVPDYAKVIRETPTPDLVAVLTERFFEGMQSAITAAHKGEAPAKAKVHSPSVVREAPPPPPPKTRVGILGLGGDREHVLQKVGHLGLDIVFLDGHPHHTPARADFYIIHKTAAHAWHDRLKAQVSHSRVFFADGGISEVVRYLHDIHARQKSQ